MDLEEVKKIIEEFAQEIDFLKKFDLLGNPEYIVKTLKSIFWSDNFIHYFHCYLANLGFLFYECDKKEKFSFLKITLLLLGELKNINFDERILKINEVLKENEKEKITDSNRKSIEEFVNNCYSYKKEVIDYSDKYSKLFFWIFLSVFRNLVFYEMENEIRFDKSEFIKTLSLDFRDYLNDSDVFLIPDNQKRIVPVSLDLILANKIYNIIDQLNSTIDIKEIKEILQVFLYFLYSITTYNENLAEICNINDENKYKELFEKLFYNSELLEKKIWAFIENTKKANKSNINFIIEGRYDNNILPISFYILKQKNEKDIEIKLYLYESMFVNENILVIKLNLENLKKNNINTLRIKEKIDNEINLFHKNNSSYKNIKSFVLIDEKIISYPKSYNILENILKDKGIIVIQPNKICQEKNKINIKINQEILPDKNLELEINKLKQELINQKNINKNLELKLQNMKEELVKEQKKYKELSNKLNKEPLSKEKSKMESKESLYEIILDKDKEIKELREKLSRFPFELKKDEKLMSIIFTSQDQKIHNSIICKNTDKFNKVEDKLYEIFPDYSETENYFIVNGNKINKYKTLDDNKIKNNDIIILNIIE